MPQNEGLCCLLQVNRSLHRWECPGLFAYRARGEGWGGRVGAETHAGWDHRRLELFSCDWVLKPAANEVLD